MIISDPRLDLSYDSKEWSMILVKTYQENIDLFSTLHGFRCCGLRLHRGREGYALRPDLDPNNSKWITKEGYIQDCNQWLIPHQKEIVELLNWLNNQEV